MRLMLEDKLEKTVKRLIFAVIDSIKRHLTLTVLLAGPPGSGILSLLFRSWPNQASRTKAGPPASP